jgi:ABC-2 type transport system ATP-binding protein
MSAVVEVHGLTKRYGSVAALDGIDLTLREHTVHGLLGRNGAGKTTLLQIIAGQILPTAGAVRVFGGDPYDNGPVMAQVCLASEGLAYVDTLSVDRVLRVGAIAFPHWDAAWARALAGEFDLPLERKIKQLSRGMRSALTIVVGLASRAPLTCFDEPYIGLDAAARQLFYDLLLAEITERPRTVVVSTHLIDEIADLLERVVIIDRGRVAIDDDADALRQRAVIVAGPTPTVERFAGARPQLHREEAGGFARITLDGGLSREDRATADAAGLTVEAASLQRLMVSTTSRSRPEPVLATGGPAPEVTT